uniref:Endonuclease/exonuclease/phosphatase domain-containing protein n=1 Tax=Trichogramma kaykai TaxID=54128 RepID=A0ABD2WNW7_9HYME
MNTGSEPTFVGERGESVIDLTFASVSLYNRVGSWRVSDVYTSSDHKAIVYEILLEENQGPISFGVLVVFHGVVVADPDGLFVWDNISQQLNIKKRNSCTYVDQHRGSSLTRLRAAISNQQSVIPVPEDLNVAKN